MFLFDLYCLDLELLYNHEIKQINDYQQLLFDHVAPFLTNEERAWLQANLLIK